MSQIPLFAVYLSSLLQLISACGAVWLIVFRKKRAIGLMLLAVCLTAFHRSVFWHRIINGEEIKIDLFWEMSESVISLVILAAFLYLSRLITSLQNERDKLAEAEKTLKETDTKLQALIYAIPDMVILKDVEGRHLVVNKTAEKFIGLTQSEVTGKTNEEILPPDLAAICRKSDEAAMKSPEPVYSESLVTGKDGAGVFLDTVKVPIHDDRGELRGLVTVSRDVTKYRRAEEALKTAIIKTNEEKAKTESIIAAIGDGINIQDTEYKILYQNEVSRAAFGHHIGEYCYKAFQNRDHVCERCHLSLAFADGNVHTLEQKRITDKGTFYYEISASPLRNAEGKIIAGIELVREITGRKMAEGALKAAMLREHDEKARSEAVISAIGDSLVVIDPDFRIIYQNQVDRDIIGNVVGQICYKAFEGRQTMCENCPVKISFKDGQVRRGERIAATKAGTMHLDITASPLRDSAGNIIAVVEMVRDVTERKRAEEALRVNEERLRLALMAANQGLFDLDIDAGEAAVSPEYATMLGYDPSDFRETNAKWIERLHPDDRERAVGVYRDYIAGKIPFYTVEFRQKTRTGDWIWILSHGKIFEWDAEGKPLRMLGTHTDITERRKLLEQLENLNRNLAERVLQEIEKNRVKEELIRLQSRHAAMGEMIDNIAHQWRQPLNNLGLIMQGMQMKFDDGSLTPDKMREKAKAGMSLIKYMSQTINDFSNFFRPDKAIAKFRVKEVVTTALSFIETSLKRNAIEVVEDIGSDITIKGYRNEYAQVIINILNNARDVLVERCIQKPVITLRASLENNASVLTIADNGGGISEELIGRIFVPNFTTKAHNKGTGIGLYMAKMIIESNMKGKISVSNNKEGAVFRIEVQGGE